MNSRRRGPYRPIDGVRFSRGKHRTSAHGGNIRHRTPFRCHDVPLDARDHGVQQDLVPGKPGQHHDLLRRFRGGMVLLPGSALRPSAHRSPGRHRVAGSVGSDPPRRSDHGRVLVNSVAVHGTATLNLPGASQQPAAAQASMTPIAESGHHAHAVDRHWGRLRPRWRSRRSNSNRSMSAALH